MERGCEGVGVKNYPEVLICHDLRCSELVACSMVSMKENDETWLGLTDV